MKKNSYRLLLLCSAALIFSACQKTIDKPFVVEPPAATTKTKTSESSNKVYVSSVDELYAAVNDANNAGTEVILAPGTYLLNSSYPNGGRLELQADMSLKGQPGQIDAVLIDESALPNSSFFLSPGLGTGGIRMGRGTNTIEWFSVKGGNLAVNPFSVIDGDLPASEAFIEISHVKVIGNGSRLGINFRNRLAEHAGRKIHAVLKDNEITGLVNAVGFGLSLQNANGASGSSIEVYMNQNYIHGNRIGILAGNGAGASAMQNSSIEIKSYGDRLEGNGCGLDPSGGVSQTSPTPASNNTTIIEMHGTSIRDNNPGGMPQLTPINGALPGGIYAACAYNSINNIGGINLASNNTMKMYFYGCDISNNNGTDITAFAAWCNPACVLAGSNNLLEIYLNGISGNATVNATASSPTEAAGTNVVNVYR